MASIGLLVLRLVIGGIFAVHGYPKLFGGQGKGKDLSGTAKATLGEGFVEQVEQGGVSATAGMMESLGLQNPQAAGWALALVEFIGGIAVALGFKTRLFAAGLAFSQMVAINKAHADQGLGGGYEYNIALIGGTAALAIAGPGKIALDH